MTTSYTLSDMISAIRCTTGAYGFIGGGNEASLAEHAQEWIDAGFGADAEDWWEAGAFDADCAASMRDADLRPQDVSGPCTKLDGYSWGYAYSNGDCTLSDVIEQAAE